MRNLLHLKLLLLTRCTLGSFSSQAGKGESKLTQCCFWTMQEVSTFFHIRFKTGNLQTNTLYIWVLRYSMPSCRYQEWRKRQLSRRRPSVAHSVLSAAALIAAGFIAARSGLTADKVARSLRHLKHKKHQIAAHESERPVEQGDLVKHSKPQRKFLRL